MEWHIMNVGGLNGLCSSLGHLEDGVYVVSDEAEGTTLDLLEQLQDDDVHYRTIRRELAIVNIVEKDLVPLICHIEDDPTIFFGAIKLLANLTQPTECLILPGPNQGQGQVHCPWLKDVEKMLTSAKVVCSEENFLSALFREMRIVIEDTGDDLFSDEDCDYLNQCLIFLRNLLHIQNGSSSESLSDTHITLLMNLFKFGVEEILLKLLKARQKEYWGITIIQLISLLYKDLVEEIFKQLDDGHSSSLDSCGSSSCSLCEVKPEDEAMSEGSNDNQNVFEDCDRGQISADQRLSSQDNSQGIGKEDNPSRDSDGNCDLVLEKSDEQKERLKAARYKSGPYFNVGEDCSSSCRSENFRAQFKEACKIERGESSAEDLSSDENIDSVSNFDDKEEGKKCCHCAEKFKTERKFGKQWEKDINIEQLGVALTRFTQNFIKEGLSSLIDILKYILLYKPNSNLDDSYFLWTVAFFIKFARKNKIQFQCMRDVFRTENFGFLVYEAVVNCEQLLLGERSKQAASVSMKRLHLTVSALREMFKTLKSYTSKKDLSEDERLYLDNLQRELCDMSDLRQCFLWLIRSYKSEFNNKQFLRDIIVTNHYFLLMLETWLKKGFSRKKFMMLDHVKQFASADVMLQYGLQLQSFEQNDHHINSCVFTMMHHVAGDCGHSETLLQLPILRVFTSIQDSNFRITPEMNDLMEYILHKFLSAAMDDPFTCAWQLCMENNTDGDMDDETKFTEWTSEEEDKLMMWYSELQDDPAFVVKMVDRFREAGIQKTEIEILSQLCWLGWIDHSQMERIMEMTAESLKDMEADKQTSPQASPKKVKEKEMKSTKCEDSLVVMKEIMKLDEREIVPTCVKKMTELNLGENVAWLQDLLCELAYVKLDSGKVEKKYVEEPVLKFFEIQNKSVPVVPYSDAQEKALQNPYFYIIFDRLGFHMSEDVGSVCPWVPNFWSIDELIEKAQMLGPLDEGNLKFSLDILQDSDLLNCPMKKIEKEYTPDIIKPVFRTERTKSKMSETLWMDMIQSFNSQDDKVQEESMKTSSTSPVAIEGIE